MTTPDPGVYKGVPFADYFLWEAVAAHNLEEFQPPRTPAHARERILHPDAPTEAKDFGHAFHTCLLEPERFELDYVVAPKFDRRTKVGKAGWSEFEALNKGRSLLTRDDHESFVAMRTAVLNHPTAKELLTGPGANELSILWLEGGDRKAKARLDRVGSLGGYTFVVDVKTALDASERHFQASAARYGYFRQLQWYLRGLSRLRPAERRGAFVVVEKDRPHCVAVYEVDDRALEQANRENERNLATLVECVSTGVYPGYDDGLGLIDYPSWAVDRLDLGA